MKDDLLIIGAGTLGRRVGAMWPRVRERAEVLAETCTDVSHDGLRRLGLSPRLRSEPDPAPAANVLFCVPPSATVDYVAEIRRAVSLWSGEGALLFTSSTAVYVVSDGEICAEDGALADTPRAQRLLDAEGPIIEAGGMVVRLAGLYDEDRGPHRVYLRTTEAESRPDGLVNLIHYDDAASLCTAALTRGHAGEIYVGCDDRPFTRQSIADLAYQSARYADLESRCRTRFTGEDGPRGRRCLNAWTRQRLDWTPTYPTFFEWIG